MTEPSPWQRRDTIIAAMLMVTTTIIVAITAGSLGFTRDEGYYFKAAHLYAEWWRLLWHHPGEALTTAAIDAHLSYNPEHPFLMKGLFALSLAIRDALGLPIHEHTAMRFPAWVMAGIAVSSTYLLARTVTGRMAATAAAAMIITMPHVFWHMHVACFDVAVTAGHTVAVLAFVWLRGSTPTTLSQSLWRSVLFGAVVGACCSTKHNVLLVPLVFILTALLFQPRHQGRATVIPWWLLALPLVAVPVYVLLWPYLWPDVMTRIGKYLAFHLHHEHYPIAYFGELLEQPPFPWLFPFVMSALTIPVAIVIATMVGTGMTIAGWKRSTPLMRERLWLLLVNAAFPFVLIALPSTPIFGGTKHWMNALPFLCVMAGMGLNHLFTSKRLAVVIVLLCGPGVMQIADHWPYGLGSYNELAGFSRGAADLGMQRTFWGYELRELAPTIAATGVSQLHPGDVNADSIAQYQQDGLLPSTTRYQGSVGRSDAAFVEPQGEFKQQLIEVWNQWGRRPNAIIDVDGVPIGVWQQRQ